MAETGLTYVLKSAVIIELTPLEAGALDALVGYGIEPFLKVFYEHMGESLLKPYEGGMRSLFETIKAAPLESFIRRTKDARKVMDGTHFAKEKQ